MKKIYITALLVSGVAGQAFGVPQIKVEDFDFNKLETAYARIKNDRDALIESQEFRNMFAADGGIEALDPDVVEDYALFNCCMPIYTLLEIAYYTFKRAFDGIPQTQGGFTSQGAFIRFIEYMCNNKSLMGMTGPMVDRGMAYALQLSPTLYQKMKIVAAGTLKGALAAQVTMPLYGKNLLLYERNHPYLELTSATQKIERFSKETLRRAGAGAVVGGLYGGYKALTSKPSYRTEPLRRKKTWSEFFGMGKK